MTNRPTTGRRDWIGPILRAIPAAFIGFIAGIAILIGTAAFISSPVVFLLAGLVGFLAVYWLMLCLLTRRQPDTRPVLFFAGAVIVTGLFAWTTLRPLGDPQLPPDPVPNQQFWNLPTGSRIAYVHLAPETSNGLAPVVFLHGGPGVPDMAGDSAYFGQLTDDGFDIYVYDQIGRGRSARLEDPEDYTLARDVTDLDTIRQQIDASKMILIGHSYGGTLAAAYAATHPDRVARMVLISPGDPSPAAGAASMTSRLSVTEKLGVYSLLLQPRALLGYTLLQVNPDAAHAFVGDAEMDARFDRIYNRTRPALHCDSKPPGPELHGLGFYAHYTRNAPRSPDHQDFLPALDGARIPTLIFKGRCDYLSWSSAQTYRSALPESHLIYLDDAGHNAYQDAPERVLTDLRAFLLRNPPPDPYDTNASPPADYEGPS